MLLQLAPMVNINTPLSVSPSQAWIAYGMGKQPTKARGGPAPLQITTTRS